MKLSKHYAVVMAAVMGLGLSTVGCDDDGGDDTDANVSDGSVDASSTDVLIKLDTNTTDGGGNVNKDGATGDASSDAGGDAAPGATACSDYCDKLEANCTTKTQYMNKGDCMSACQNKLAWLLGTDNTGNTLMCRSYHAGLAAGSTGNANTHCPHAGPTGGGLCGGFCENYCYLAAKNCTANNKLYQSDAECMTACAGFATTGMFGDTTGNTLQCRLYHVNAARGDANLHCPHASQTPTAPCVN
ncbi:MAG: hypothetical protein SF187_21755 [Deltaproteobacteria bacterium]|nr:hypothetical protein [Deltaproteobacteria bacterium]